jgi:hypothetical protein
VSASYTEISGDNSDRDRAHHPLNSEGNVMTLTGWGVLLGLLLVAAIVVAAIALIIRFVIRHRRGYD